MDGLRWRFATDVVHPNTTECHVEGNASDCGGPFVGTLREKDGTVKRPNDTERPRVWVHTTSGLPELLFFSNGGMDPTAQDGRTRGVTVAISAES